MQSTRTETRAVGCGRLSQGQTMRAEGRHVPHMFMSPFTVELILTAVHCLLIGRPRAPSSPTAREMPRGVAVASIARLPSSTDDPSGSTADRHVPRLHGEVRVGDGVRIVIAVHPDPAEKNAVPMRMASWLCVL